MLAPSQQSQQSPESVAEALFDSLDANGDGIIDRQELTNRMLQAFASPNSAGMPSNGAAADMHLEELPQEDGPEIDFESALRLAMQITERLELSLKSAETRLRQSDQKNAELEDALAQLTAALEQMHRERGECLAAAAVALTVQWAHAGMSESELGRSWAESEAAIGELQDIRLKLAVLECQKDEAKTTASEAVSEADALRAQLKAAAIEREGMVQEVILSKQAADDAVQTAADAQIVISHLQQCIASATVERDQLLEMLEDLRTATDRETADNQELRGANEGLRVSLEEAREAVFDAVVERNTVSSELAIQTAEHQATLDALEAARAAAVNARKEWRILADTSGPLPTGEPDRGLVESQCIAGRYCAAMSRGALSTGEMPASYQHGLSCDECGTTGLEGNGCTNWHCPDCGFDVCFYCMSKYTEQVRQLIDQSSRAKLENDESSRRIKAVSDQLTGIASDDSNNAWSKWLLAEAEEAVRHNGERKALMKQLERISVAALNSQAELN